jgi:hypothetical protein
MTSVADILSTATNQDTITFLAENLNAYTGYELQKNPEYNTFMTSSGTASNNSSSVLLILAIAVLFFVVRD